MYMDYATNPVQILCNFAHLLPKKLTQASSLAFGALRRVASPIFSRPIPITIITCGLFWSAVFSPVYAQACDKRAEIITHLENKYKEAPTAIGLANNGALVELLTADDGKTWTLLITDRKGMSCLIAAGQSWETVIRRLGNPT